MPRALPVSYTAEGYCGGTVVETRGDSPTTQGCECPCAAQVKRCRCNIVHSIAAAACCEVPSRGEHARHCGSLAMASTGLSPRPIIIRVVPLSGVPSLATGWDVLRCRVVLCERHQRGGGDLGSQGRRGSRRCARGGCGSDHGRSGQGHHQRYLPADGWHCQRQRRRWRRLSRPRAQLAVAKARHGWWQS